MRVECKLEEINIYENDLALLLRCLAEGETAEHFIALTRKK